ncbi:MAG: YcxB family protein [Pedobacter sp.]|uniref:YcxB family protein n=1 Tax=Pedobacter sp. TaxID=1411316 RepID=UPI0028082C33|nr:YcxB family protein [Pedobacter sp.]MDQ8006004.1 YcxB family protein [Pedobacter sp.]
MLITLNYAYTQEQLKRAYRFNVFPTPRARYFMLFFSCFIFGVGTLVWLIKEPSSFNPLILKALKNIMIAVCLLWLLVLLAVALNYFYLPVYAFKKSPYYQGNFTVNLIPEGLAYKQQIVEQDNHSATDGFVSWKTFTKKAENEEFIILFIGRKHSIIPKKAFDNEADLQDFRLFLMAQKHIMNKKFNGKEIWG